VNIETSSPAQDFERFLLFRRPLAGRAIRQSDSADTKKARFAANSLGKSDSCAQFNRRTKRTTTCWPGMVYDIATHHRGSGDRNP
jgi:hypothetical protein